MSVRIFSTCLVGAALLGVALCGCAPDLSAMRPEVAKPLGQAERLYQYGDMPAAMASIQIAEAVPNQTADEKHGVAVVKDEIVSYMTGNHSGTDNNPFFQDQMNAAQPSVAAYLPPGDVGPNNPGNVNQLNR